MPDIFDDVDQPPSLAVHPEPGAITGRECSAYGHGTRNFDFGFTRLYFADQYDPECGICRLHAEHDHLHLDGTSCTTPGIDGQPGRTVRCKCGGYHH